MCPYAQYRAAVVYLCGVACRAALGQDTAPGVMAPMLRVRHRADQFPIRVSQIHSRLHLQHEATSGGHHARPSHRYWQRSTPAQAGYTSSRQSRAAAVRQGQSSLHPCCSQCFHCKSFQQLDATLHAIF